MTSFQASVRMEMLSGRMSISGRSFVSLLIGTLLLLLPGTLWRSFGPTRGRNELDSLSLSKLLLNVQVVVKSKICPPCPQNIEGSLCDFLVLFLPRWLLDHVKNALNEGPQNSDEGFA